MTSLKQLRRLPRWLILLFGFIALAVTSAALMPHDDGTGDDIHCLVCKAGHHPLTELSAGLAPEPPLTFTAFAPPCELSFALSPVYEPRSTRAPPA